ncbi:precorrin-6y C5,15-methyltransferase (decarboxylating) subunit CbiE [Roseomonas elaeocarpi]|uniref:Precorrin-6y C5,15-methyltransferase (Decarboxylating) subunit CbiE n=1 Tax=Roseomonas elaeocarpi TaxID=907779 RepID=A0ABV6JYF5_9PROT
MTGLPSSAGPAISPAAHSAPWLSVLGIGEDGPEAMAPAARALLGAAAHVFGGARHLALAAPLIRGTAHPWPSPMRDGYRAILEHRGEAVVVLASGDPFCFGVGSALRALVGDGEMLCLPAPSAFSLARARLGWAMQEVAELSFCGRPIEAMRPRLQPGARLLCLSADAATPAQVAAYLRAEGFGASRLILLEALGAARERVRDITAGVPATVDPLNMLAVEVVAEPGARVLPLAPGLPDAWFENDGQITKREIRAMTLSALAPREGELLWDLGAGSGSVSIEWMLQHPRNRAVAVEARADRAARATRNALSLGVPGLRVVTGTVPEALAGLEPPDAVFVGGGASVPGVLDAGWAALRPGGRIVANVVTVEGEMALLRAWERWGGALTRIGVERLDRVGRMHGMRPAMTVTQWSAVRAGAAS